MKVLATIFLLISSSLVFAQKTFIVDNFSKDYYGKIRLSDTVDVFSKGWVAVYDRKTNKQLIKVASDELALSRHDGKAVANIRSYGEQSLLIYDDFNFDGKKDFAICDGHNSCYHGPSFRIYLATSQGFLYSKEFTRLAQEYCGMFAIDVRAKRLHTSTKSGCCWHEFSEFAVVNNKPEAVKIVTREYHPPFITTTEEIRNGKAMVKRSVNRIDTEQGAIDLVLSFTVPKNGKQIVLYNLDAGMLYYALLRKDSTVEFSYPVETADENPPFRFDSTAGALSVTFKNKDATYKVYERQNEIGITITTNNKTADWIGDTSTKAGSLDKLRKGKPDNVQ